MEYDIHADFVTYQHDQKAETTKQKIRGWADPERQEDTKVFDDPKSQFFLDRQEKV